MNIQPIFNYKHNNNNITFSHAQVIGKLPRYLCNSEKPFVQNTINSISYLRYYINGITKKQGHFKIHLFKVKDTNNCAIQITLAQNREFSLVEQFSIYGSKQLKTACNNLRNRMVCYRMGCGEKFDILPNIDTVERRSKQENANEKYLLKWKLNSESFIKNLLAEKRRKTLEGWIEK